MLTAIGSVQSHFGSVYLKPNSKTQIGCLRIRLHFRVQQWGLRNAWLRGVWWEKMPHLTFGSQEHCSRPDFAFKQIFGTWIYLLLTSLFNFLCCSLRFFLFGGRESVAAGGRIGESLAGGGCAIFIFRINSWTIEVRFYSWFFYFCRAPSQWSSVLKPPYVLEELLIISIICLVGVWQRKHWLILI